MTELTYKQAAVLCRVPDMPIQGVAIHGHGQALWWTVKTGPDEVVSKDQHSRLTPGAPLNPEQAAICLAMGVEVEAMTMFGTRAGNRKLQWRPMDTAYGYYVTTNPNSKKKYRVPPEEPPHE